MNTLRKILVGAVSAAAVVGLASAANAQPSSASASVNASIILPISIAKDQDVAFGTIARPATGNGTVTLDPTASSAAVSTTAGAIVAQGARGQFTVTGDAGRLYTLTGNTGTLTLTNGGGDTITFTKNVVAGAGTLGTLGGTAGSFASGTQTLYAGGSFPIAATTVPGTYSGTLSLTVNYQ